GGGSEFDIDVEPRAGGPARRVTQVPGYAFGPAWSPDGREIVFEHIASRARPDRPAVMIADVATGETREVGTALSTPWGPAWSPGGRFYGCSAHTRFSGDPYTVAIHDAQGGTTTFSVVSHGWDLTAPLAVGPDGRSIVVGGWIDYVPGKDIWIMRGDGSD